MGGAYPWPGRGYELLESGCGAARGRTQAFALGCSRGRAFRQTSRPLRSLAFRNRFNTSSRPPQGATGPYGWPFRRGCNLPAACARPPGKGGFALPHKHLERGGGKGEKGMGETCSSGRNEGPLCRRRQCRARLRSRLCRGQSRRRETGTGSHPRQRSPGLRRFCQSDEQLQLDARTGAHRGADSDSTGGRRPAHAPWGILDPKAQPSPRSPDDHPRGGTQLAARTAGGSRFCDRRFLERPRISEQRTPCESLGSFFGRRWTGRFELHDRSGAPS